MDESSVVSYITSTFADVATTRALGYVFFFYGDDRMLPFATLAVEDNEHERASKLDRPGVYRLNIGVSRDMFQSLFGEGKVDVSAYDFAALDTIMPHPDYALQAWICILNPSDETFQTLQPMLAEAYDIAKTRNARRKPTATA